MSRPESRIPGSSRPSSPVRPVYTVLSDGKDSVEPPDGWRVYGHKSPLVRDSVLFLET